MDRLALDDPRWNELATRDSVARNPSHREPRTPIVVTELAHLLARPTGIERFRELWPSLCSEGTAWSAAYAAVPHIVELARQLPPEQRVEHLFFVGLVVLCSCPDQGEAFEIKPYLEDSYRRALTEALALLAATLPYRHDASDTRYLLAAAAALKGHRKLSDVLAHLDCVCESCPKCGATVYPDELRQALDIHQ
jgi:hypothetical protein